MVVMIADEQILPAQQVCQSCLMSDHHGLPRWYGSQLGCGKIDSQTASRQAKIYRCQMGFKVTQIN